MAACLRNRVLRAPRLQRREAGGASVQTVAAITPGKVEEDFAHHAKRLARLNHGSFGACPKPVLKYWRQQQEAWLAEPDTWFFSGRLQDALRQAALSASKELTAEPLVADQVCLVENATVATVAIARRWARLVRPGEVVVVLSVIYGASLNLLRDILEPTGARIEVLEVPFPCVSHVEVLQRLREQLERLKEKGVDVRFALLDHVSSQPALLFPAKEMVDLCRRFGAADIEVAVDGSHSLGSCSFDVAEIGAEWFFTNTHKWGFNPSTATLMHALRPELMRDTRHPIPSWNCGQGLAAEAAFPGTRDFSAMLTVPAAMEYLRRWRSDAGETSAQFCHRRVLESARELAEAWGTAEELLPEEFVATQAMVRLPHALRVDDVPGTPGEGVRSRLRDRYCVEAAIGNFGPGKGAWVRLSYAVYNTHRDIQRLRDAVLEIVEEQAIVDAQRNRQTSSG